MTQADPTGSAQLKREWLRREKEVLARLGFQHLRRDLYQISLGPDWAGEVGLPKRAATGPALMVFFDPPSAILDHLPTQRLMRELYELGPKEPDFITLPGGWHGVPSGASLDVISALRPSNLDEVDAAVTLTVRMLEDDVVPWMRSHADLDALADALGVAQASPGSEARRLETLAALGCVRGDTRAARSALRTLRREHMPTGIPSIDEPQERYCRALEARLDEMDRQG